MLQSESDVKIVPEEDSCFFDFEEDEIFEQNIDDFDNEMDNEYDDGIADSELEDSYDEDLSDDPEDDQDTPGSRQPLQVSPDELDELDDYDELDELEE